ncbi:MAG: hypothetical protein NTW87_13130, partial [Planctomycetota bacterium]|nr:hypothetical protein [Planctomycetota bacterium]
HLETLHQVKHDEPVAPRRLQPSIPRDIETICLKCLQKDPANRYSSAQELAEDLRRFLNNETIVARPATTVERSVKWARRRPALAALVGVSVLALAALVGGGVWYNTRLAAALQMAKAEAMEKDRQRKRAEEALLDAERNKYFSDIAQAEKKIEAGETKQARELLDRAASWARGWEWGRLLLLREPSLLTLKVWDVDGHTGRVNSVAFSPDGKRLATGSDVKKVINKKPIPGSEEPIVIETDDETVKVWDVETGRELLLLKGHASSVLSVAFSPDGKRLATAGHTAKVWDAETGRELLTLEGHTELVKSLAFSPDSKRLATASADNTAKVWDAETGRELLTLKHKWMVTSVAFAPDGKRLVTGITDKTAKVWDAETGRELLTLTGHTSEVRSVAFSPDGLRLATGSDDQTARVWQALDWTKPLETVYGEYEVEKARRLPAQRAKEQYDAAMARGRRHLADMDFDGAEAAFNQAFASQDYENDKVATRCLARAKAAREADLNEMDALLKTGAFDEAERQIAAAEKTKPGGSRLAQLKEALKSHKLFAALVDAAKADLANDVDLGDVEKKIADAERLLPKDPRTARLREQVKNKRENLAAFAKQQQFDAELDRVDAAVKAGAFDEADMHIAAAEKIKPGDPMIAPAREKVSQKREQAPRLAEARARRAKFEADLKEVDAILKAGGLDEAEQRLAAADKVYPDDAEIGPRRATLNRLKREKFDGFLKVAEALLQAKTASVADAEKKIMEADRAIQDAAAVYPADKALQPVRDQLEKKVQAVAAARTTSLTDTEKHTQEADRALQAAAASKELKDALESYDRDVAAGRYEQAERTAQAVEDKHYGQWTLGALVPQGLQQLAEKRARAGRSLLATILPPGKDVPSLDETKDRRCGLALSMLRRGEVAWTDEDRQAVSRALPHMRDLYEIPSPRNAVLSVEFPNLKTALTSLEVFLRAAHRDELNTVYQDSALRKKLKEAGDWYSDNVTIHSTVLPVGELNEQLTEDNIAYVPDPRHGMVFGTGPALTHRSMVIVEGAGLDHPRDARRKDTEATFFFRIHEAYSKAGKADRYYLRGDDADLLQQVDTVGARVLIGPERLRIMGRLWARRDTELDKKLHEPSRVLTPTTLGPFSNRVLLLATTDPRNVVLDYIMRVLVRGSLDSTGDGLAQADKDEQVAFINAVHKVLKRSSAQCSAGVERDSTGDEAVLFVSEDMPDLRVLFKIGEAGGRAAARELGLDKLLQMEELPALKHDEFAVNGFKLIYRKRPFHLLYANGRGRFLIALGRKPQATMLEGLDRLSGKRAEHDGLLESKIVQAANVPPNAGSYVLLDASLRTKPDSEKVVFYSNQFEGLSTFCFDVSASALASLCEALSVYDEGKERGASCFAPEMQKLNEMFKPGWHQQLRTKGRPAAVVAAVAPEDKPSVVEDALPVLVAFAFTPTNSGLQNEAAKLYEARFAEHKARLRPDDPDFVLSQAVMDLARDRDKAAGRIEEALRPQRVAFAKDPRTPAWREAVLDLIISETRFLASTAEWAMPYANGACSILQEAYGPPNQERRHVADKLGAVAWAWKAHILFFKGRAREDYDLEVRERAAGFLQDKAFRDSIWHNITDKLYNRVRSLQ